MANVISYKGQKYVRVDEMSDKELKKIESSHDNLLKDVESLLKLVKKFEYALYDNDFQYIIRKLNSTRTAVAKALYALS